MSIREFSIQVYHRLRYSIDFFWNETSLRDFVPRGHYHSPLPDIEKSCQFVDHAIRRNPCDGLPGIILNGENHKLLIKQMIEFASEFDWPEVKSDGRRFYTVQDWFNIADSFVLFSILRLLRPKRIIEIGCGFSSALMLDTREYKLFEKVEFVFIDPNPRRLQTLLKPSDAATSKLIEKDVQAVSTDVFGKLSAGDILFVNSSHVSRPGSDLNYIIFEILPSLTPGVWIHFHDILWPFEYPPDWIRRGFSWNEAYLLRAFLMFNPDFEVAFWAPYAAAIDADQVSTHLSEFNLTHGQSIWIRRISV